MTAVQLLVSGAYEEALARARADFEASETDAEAYLIASQASLLLGQFDQALEYALSSLATGPENAAKYSSLGLAYFKTEKVALAKASFGKAALLEPRNAQVQFNLGLAHEADGLISLASDHYFLAGKLALDARIWLRAEKYGYAEEAVEKSYRGQETLSGFGPVGRPGFAGLATFDRRLFVESVAGCVKY